ncbi:MAG TPA: ASCH domain-containing protein [Thermoguttaceae bacterium]|nr:ASCH domain-containing protein [Thermoguttaceae bacterium]HUX16042.1 ASCH domain-containing protein [Phycisphaerae bacterium]
MKAITVRRYWAWAIAAGHKRVENRGWATDHRGPLAIHAARRQPADEADREQLVALGLDPPADPTASAVVAVVELVDCVRLGDCPLLPDPYDLAGDPLATGPVCWVLENVRRLAEPIAMSGQQAVWEADVPGFVGGGA